MLWRAELEFRNERDLLQEPSERERGDVLLAGRLESTQMLVAEEPVAIWLLHRGSPRQDLATLSQRDMTLYIRQREILDHLVVSERCEKEPGMAIPLLSSALRWLSIGHRLLLSKLAIDKSRTRVLLPRTCAGAHRVSGSLIARRIATPRGSRRNGSSSGSFTKS